MPEWTHLVCFFWQPSHSSVKRHTIPGLATMPYDDDSHFGKPCLPFVGLRRPEAFKRPRSLALRSEGAHGWLAGRCGCLSACVSVVDGSCAIPGEQLHVCAPGWADQADWVDWATRNTILIGIHKMTAITATRAERQIYIEASRLSSSSDERAPLFYGCHRLFALKTCRESIRTNRS